MYCNRRMRSSNVQGFVSAVCHILKATLEATIQQEIIKVLVFDSKNMPVIDFIDDATFKRC